MFVDVIVCATAPFESHPFLRLQALSLAEQERSSLQEKLVNVQRELENAFMENERQKREWNARHEQQLNNINSLQSELKNQRANFEETRYEKTIR